MRAQVLYGSEQKALWCREYIISTTADPVHVVVSMEICVVVSQMSILSADLLIRCFDFGFHTFHSFFCLFFFIRIRRGKKKLIRRLGERKTKLGTAGFWLNVFRFLFYCVKNKRLATPQNAHRMPNRTVCFREKCSPFTIINWKNAMASARYCHHQNIYQPQKRTHNQRDAPNDERWNLNYLCRDAATAAYGYLGFTLVRNGIFSCSSQSPSAMVFCCFKSFHQLKFMTEIEHTEHKAKDLRLRWETTLDWTIVGCSLCDWWCRNWCL